MEVHQVGDAQQVHNFPPNLRKHLKNFYRQTHIYTHNIITI